MKESEVGGPRFRAPGVSGPGWEAPGAAPDVAPSHPPTPADLYSAEPGEEEPAWVQTEREQFRDFRDLNKDGKLDGSEVGHWVLPPAQDQPLVEANHLLHESDTDKVQGRRGMMLARWAEMTKTWAWDFGVPIWLEKERGTKMEVGREKSRNRDPGRGGRRPWEPYLAPGRSLTGRAPWHPADL